MAGNQPHQGAAEEMLLVILRPGIAGPWDAELPILVFLIVYHDSSCPLSEILSTHVFVRDVDGLIANEFV